VTRRTFSFASLVFASTPAFADSHTAGPSVGVRLASSVDVTPRGDVLHIRLAILNTSDVPLDVMVELGSRPGPDLRVFLAGEGEDIELAEVTKVERREILSRMGPRPRYEALAIGGRLEVGRWTYGLPQGADREAFRVVAHVTVAQADRPIELVHLVRSSGPAAV
jgi:hypothetical protein